MTVTRDLAKVYNSNGRNKEAIALYEDARLHYMNQPQIIRHDGDLDTPFDWYTLCKHNLIARNELNIYLGLLSNSRQQPTQSIRVIHSTSRWLHGRSAETFWDSLNDSREWDSDDSRRLQTRSYVPGKWDPSRYSLPMEIRVRLGINWLQAQNVNEAMVPSLPR